MIQESGGDAFPDQWRYAGTRTVSPRRDEIDRTATAAYPSDQAGSAGCRWLTLAAEMAGVASGSRRPSPGTASTSWARLPRIATRTLGADAGSVRAARDFAIATVHRWGTAERSQDIAIVVSELLTNALRHALPGSGDTRRSGDTRLRRPIQLGLLQPGPCVLCAVADPSTAAPALQARGSLAETGRGLHIVCALSDQWGYTPSETGKVVWAMFYPRLTACVSRGTTGRGRLTRLAPLRCVAGARPRGPLWCPRPGCPAAARRSCRR
jgi:anti-sigma regulatory factor (Ser/Thr protein kinase)